MGALKAAATPMAAEADSENPPPMYINVQFNHLGKTNNAIIHENGSIDTLKHIIMNKCYVDVHEHRLAYNGKVLDDGCVSDYGVKDGAEINFQVGDLEMAGGAGAGAKRRRPPAHKDAAPTRTLSRHRR